MKVLRRRPVVAALAGCILAGCGSSTTSHSVVSDRSTCETIQSLFFYPVIPATGETVPMSSAVRVEALLEQAQSPVLRDEAPGLERAIRSNDKAAMVRIFGNLSTTVCPEVAGVPPAT